MFNPTNIVNDFFESVRLGINIEEDTQEYKLRDWYQKSTMRSKVKPTKLEVAALTLMAFKNMKAGKHNTMLRWNEKGSVPFPYDIDHM